MRIPYLTRLLEIKEFQLRLEAQKIGMMEEQVLLARESLRLLSQLVLKGGKKK